MARSPSKLFRTEDQVFWIQFGVFALVATILATVIWALVTAAAIQRAAPRSAVERQLRVLEQEVTANPQDSELWAKYIQAQARVGRYSAARRSVDDADEALGRRTGPVATEVARVDFLAGDYEAALKGTEEALVVIGEETQAEVDRLASLGVTQAPPADAEIDALLLQAEALKGLQRPEEAIKQYTVALELNPTMADILVERGLLHEQLGDVTSARSDFEQALIFIPDYEPATSAITRLGR